MRRIRGIDDGHRDEAGGEGSATWKIGEGGGPEAGDPGGRGKGADLRFPIADQDVHGGYEEIRPRAGEAG